MQWKNQHPGEYSAARCGSAGGWVGLAAGLFFALAAAAQGAIEITTNFFSETVSDQFSVSSYANNDGTANWLGDWVETGDNGSPAGGSVWVNATVGALLFENRNADNDDVTRAVALPRPPGRVYTNATLSFAFRRDNWDNDDTMAVWASTNGFATQSNLVYTVNSRQGTDAAYTNVATDVTALLGTNFSLRIQAGPNFDNNDRCFFDFVTLAFSGYDVSTNVVPDEVGLDVFKSSSIAGNWNLGATNAYYVTIVNTGLVTLTGMRLTDLLPTGATFAAGSAAIVQFLDVTTNAFGPETVADRFETVSYANNNGTTPWLGNWTETGDNATPASGSVLIRTAGGTNALVFEGNGADNDFVTRLAEFPALPGRVYTNATLAFAYRRENWDSDDSATIHVSTNNFAGQSNLVFAVNNRIGTDAAYSSVAVNVTALLGTNLAVRLRAGPNFANGDRLNFDHVTLTYSGHDVASNQVVHYTSNVQVVVVSNLAAGPTNLLVNYALPPGSNVSIRLRATLDVPLAATQLVNVATVTNARSATKTAAVTNVSIANAVGDRVWFDTDGDGLQDGGEPGLTGVTVRLYNAATNVLLATRTSGVAGAYAFTNLPSGTYVLRFLAPAGHWPALRDQGGDDALDSDVDADGYVAPFALAAGTNDATRDAGFYVPNSALGDFVWHDVDGNGLQGGGSETGLPGVAVALYDAATNLMATTATDSSGFYLFTNLATRTYFLEFGAPAGYRFALRDQGGDDALDSDADPLTGRTAPYFLPLNATNRTWDAGLYRPAAVGDFTWDDLHVNGIQELGEPGLTGLVVRLYGAASNLVATTTSGVAGAYAFTNLAPGTYFIGFTNPPLYRFTLRDQGGDDALDSDADPLTGRTAPFALVSGQTDASRDAGFYQPATLGDFAWHDLNANGLQDGGSETGLPGVVVTLYDAATNALATTTSGLSGAYAFTDLATGTYLLEFAPPAGYWISPRDQGGNDALDSDADSATGRTVPFAVTAGASALTWDAGFFRPAALGDFAWDDRNANGLQDGGSETGLPGVVVALYDAATNLLAATTSGVSGAYAFADLVPGTYLLGFAAPSAYRITLRDQGANDALDSDPDRSTGLTAAFTLVSGQNATHWDAGFYLPVSVGDFVWHDVNENGLQDGGSETGMPNVVVHLYGPTTNLLATTNTDASGYYAFTNRPPGTYLLGAMAPEGFTFTLRDQGGNDALDSDFSPVTGRIPPFYLAPGTNDPHRDLGLVTITYGLSLSKTADAIACLAAGETITYTMLIENTGTVAMAGIVLEDELPPGLAYVTNSVTWTGGSLATSGPPPELLVNLTLNVGESATVTFQATPALPSPVTQLVNVASAYSAVQPAIFAAVTNCVQFADVGVEKTASTLRPDPEQTIEFVLVATNRGPDAATGLRIADLLPDELEYASHSNGAYNAWTGIWDVGTLAAYASTTLYIQATVIEDTYGLRITNVAAVAERDLYDPDPGNDASAVVVVPRGATFAGLAWEDVDGNGQQDPGEPPLAGVAVNLYDAGDALAGARTTSAAGAYAFIDVPPGTYTLGFVSPAGYRFTRQDLGPDATDSDPDPVTGRTAPIALAGGETNDVVAAGFYRPARVGDRVWFDQNLDGLQNPAETNGIANLWVELLDTNASVVAGTFTSDEGLYLFEDLAPGTYLVRFDLSDIFAHSWITLPNVGGDDALDSDATILDGSGRAWTELFALASGQTNLLVDLGLRPQKSTRAELAEVWGEWADGQGRVAWRTESEWGTAGFFVYRLDAESGAETRLNEVLVPSVFEPAGASYGLADPAAKAGAAGRYRLEEVELSGQVLDLGEHAVVFGPPPPAPARAAAVRTVAAASPLPAAPPAAAGPAAALRTTFRGEGIYGIALAALASGFGLETFEAEELAEEGGFAFAAGGSPVPVAYDPVRARLLFHGRPPDDWYVRDNAVLISIGAGTAMPQRDPVGTAGQTQFPVTVRFEQDRYPFDSALEKPEDFYYWDYVISGTNATSLREFPLDLRGRTGPVTLNVRLQGWSSTTNEPDHRAEFRFNGAPAGAATFDDQDVRIVEWTVPAEDVLNGVNVLAVKGVLPPGRTHSYFVVDWIEAAFVRELQPTAGTAHFRCAGAETVSAAAFAEPVALALDGENRPVWIADEEGRVPGKAWQVLPDDARFAVAEAAAVPMLVPEPAAADAWFLAATNRIDYLVVAPRALAAPAQTLVDYRAGQGLRAGLAVYEDVCDLLEDGLRTPEAVPELLAYADAVWAEAPWLVVLAGNGHYDYLGALSNEVNHLPPLLRQTQDGIFASDGMLANNGGDDLPDVAIGRLPARNAADLAAMIAKIKAYEAGFGQPWQNQIVLAADTNDAAAGDFAASNAQLSRLAGARYPVARIDLNAMAINSARTSLTNWFKAGAGFIHYTGHGGVNNWSGKGLLRAADVNAMNNSNRPTTVTALSCLVGRFEAPGIDSLGELLMRKSGGGAAAVWGPSGLSRNQHALELGEAFYRAVLQDGAGTLGLAILRARRHLADAGTLGDTVDVYNLLGDPALRIAGNRNAGAAAESFAQWRWERFSPGELADPSAGGATAANFLDYALAGDGTLAAELPEFGFALPAAGSETGFIVRWKRRVKRNDVEYRLFLSHDLKNWTDAATDLEEVGATTDPDGEMETVRTRVKRTAAERTYLGVKAKKK